MNLEQIKNDINIVIESINNNDKDDGDCVALCPVSTLPRQPPAIVRKQRIRWGHFVLSVTRGHQTTIP